jgi:integrase
VRHQKLLPGRYDSPESRTAFARLQLELEASPAGAAADPAGVTVAEVLAAHLDHAQRHYRRADGTPTHEVVEYKIAYRVVRELYAHTPAAEFSPLKLKAVRSAMLSRGWCRSLVNQRVGRVRRIFKWAASEEMIAFEVYHRLTAVTGLQKGRTTAQESEPVKPVEDAVVDATLPFLNGQVRGMVEFQRLTGCRPGEACSVRRRDIDTGRPIWLYKPAHHKLAYKNKPRVIAVGPKSQALLKEFFTPLHRRQPVLAPAGRR